MSETVAGSMSSITTKKDLNGFSRSLIQDAQA
jgi:hypothetical protein